MPRFATEYRPASSPECVADIMERQQGGLIHEWLSPVEKQEDLMTIPLSYEARTGHLRCSCES